MIGCSTLTEALARSKPVSAEPPNILRTLGDIRNAVGYVPTEALGEIAHALQVTEADVAGVLSFYPELHSRPTGRHVIRVCMGESCLANHSARLLQSFQTCLHIGLGETTQDARFSLEKVYCVGNCAIPPTVMIAEDVHGRVVPYDIQVLMERYE